MRRAVGAFAGLGGLSGCNLPSSGATDQRHVIDVENYADRVRLFDG